VPTSPVPAPDLSVSVVTYNSLHCLEPLFRSLAGQGGVRWELFVVDNASTDGSAQWLRSRATGSVTLNAENVGYGRAHNQNLEVFRGRYVLFLNPDLTFGDGLFSSLVGFLDGNPQHVAVGPAVVEGPDRRPFPPRRFYPGERAVALEPGLRRSEPAWLSGCCLAMRRDALLRLGGFDPDFFLYHEETDLCLRARRAGHRIGWCEEAEVFHARRQSQRHLSGYEQERNLVAGTLRFWEKHYSEADVAKIARFRRWMASGRLALSWRGALRESSRDYLCAERDLYRQWLQDHPRSRFATAAGSLEVLLRQVRLALEWVRSGSFPGDAH
jgi:GT2 family glycosyltransferase